MGRPLRTAADAEPIQALAGRAMRANSDGHPSLAMRLFREILLRLDDPAGADPPTHRPAGADPDTQSDAAPDAQSDAQSDTQSDTEPDLAEVRVRAYVGLAGSTFELTGDTERAAALLDQAEQHAAGVGSTRLVGVVRDNRGLLMLRSGQTEAAMAALNEAVEVLAVSSPIDQCRILLNRGALHLELGSVQAAFTDLRRSSRLAAEHGLALMEFKARHNLGYVEFLRGNLARALDQMARAAAIDPGGPRPVALLDQARVLREAGLAQQADTTLQQAAELFRRDRLWQDVGEAELSRAECALIAADPALARRMAERARRRFAARGNQRWARKAEYVRLEAARLLARGPAARARVARQAGELALDCAAEGRLELARSATLLSLDIAPDQPPPVTAAQADARAAAVRLHRRDPLPLRIQVRHTRARRALVDGASGTARREIRLGLSELTAYQAGFGSLDLRTAAAVHGTALARLDIGLALGSGRASAVFASIERTRAVSTRLIPVRAPGDPRAAELLAELRQVEDVARGQEAGGDAAALARLRQRSAQLRGEIDRLSWRREGTGDDHLPERAGMASVRRALADDQAVLVSYVLHESRWYACVLDHSRVRVVPLSRADAIAALVRRVRADLDVLALPGLPAPMRRTVDTVLRHGLEALDKALLTPLGRTDGRLVLSPAGPLSFVPWSLLGSRRGLPTEVVPSATWWLHRRRPGPRGRPPRVLVVAGPGLRTAPQEAGRVAELWRTTARSGTAATTSAVSAGLATHDLAHIAAHGRHEVDSPLFSSLRLADGGLYAHELDQGKALADCVALSACDAGLATLRPGDESLGLTSALLRLGTRSVISAVARVHDDVAAQVMVRTHVGLAAGQDCADALATALTEVDDGQPPAPFVTFGASWRA